MDEPNKKTGPTPSRILSFVRLQIEEAAPTGDCDFYACSLRTEIDGQVYQWTEMIPKDLMLSQFDVYFLYGLTQLKQTILEKRNEKRIVEPGPGAVGLERDPTRLGSCRDR